MSNHEQPLVSVVMPVYNAERFLRQAIDSVLNQTYCNLELIAVDDCSTDSSLQILQEYAICDKRITVITNAKNLGVAHVRNTGISAATGEFIALIDSDDVWEATKLDRQLNLLKHENADIAYCSLDLIDEDSKQIKKPFIVLRETNYYKMLVKCDLTCSTIVAKAKLLKEHPFRSDYYHEDFLLWMELMKLPIKAVGDRKVLMHNRQVSDSRSHNKINSAKHRWKIYREALGFSFIQSCVAFVGYAIGGIIKYYF